MTQQNGLETAAVGRLSVQENVLLDKFRQASALSTRGHRVALTVMFYAGQGACDMIIEDRERIAQKPA